ncbi:MAG: homocysteine S-methyltransferase family protein [Acutalibacteraceae bacterium]
MDILKQLGKRIIFFEGGMGSILQQNGLAPGELPEVWNVEKPEFILNVHREYLKAGCDIVKTNTFGANSIKMEDSGYTAKELIEKAVSIAKQAVNENGHGLVAMDIGQQANCFAHWEIWNLTEHTKHLKKWLWWASKQSRCSSD